MAAPSLIQNTRRRIEANEPQNTTIRRLDQAEREAYREFNRRFKGCVGYCRAFLTPYGVNVQTAQAGTIFRIVVTCRFKPENLNPENLAGRPPAVKI